MNSETQSLVPATQQAESAELTVDEVQESLSMTKKGQPANTIGNCRTVFCQDPLLREAIRLNLLTDRIDIVRDLGWRRSTSALIDTDVKYLLLYFEQNYGLTSEKKLMAAALYRSKRKLLSPYPRCAEWSGVGRHTSDALLPASLSGGRRERLCGRNAETLLAGSHPPGVPSRFQI